jgi:rubrerythrin
MGEVCGEWGVTGRSTRRELVRWGAVGGSAAVAGGALLAWLPSAARSAPSASLDRRIFQFALQLEYLQAAFYAAAVDAGALRGEVLDFAETVAGHEQAHVDYLKHALGSAAGPQPRYDFGRATTDEREFLRAAVILENTGVAAYNGQAANLTKRALAAAAEIVSVEGRHAAWASSLAGLDPAPRAADPGETPEAVTATLKRTGFVQ